MLKKQSGTVEKHGARPVRLKFVAANNNNNNNNNTSTQVLSQQRKQAIYYQSHSPHFNSEIFFALCSVYTNVECEQTL